MIVPSILRPDDKWLHLGTNSEDLRALLSAYQIEMDDVYEIKFGMRSMTVYRFAVDSAGQKYAENGGAARQPPAKFTYRAGLTPEVS